METKDIVGVFLGISWSFWLIVGSLLFIYYLRVVKGFDPIIREDKWIMNQLRSVGDKRIMKFTLRFLKKFSHSLILAYILLIVSVHVTLLGLAGFMFMILYGVIVYGFLGMAVIMIVWGSFWLHVGDLRIEAATIFLFLGWGTLFILFDTWIFSSVFSTPFGPAHWIVIAFFVIFAVGGTLIASLTNNFIVSRSL